MKKTFTINLGGKIFNIDDDALDILQKYINTLKAHYSQDEDGDEIMHDIESRLAELFTEYQKQDRREVVTATDTEQAISVMGKPEDIFEEENTRELEQEQTTSTNSSQPKKLFRDPNDRILGGIASGMAAYLGLPVTLTRVCFLVLMLAYGVFFIIYIIMWILVPQAVTPHQKLQMRGKNVNISNIEDSFRTTYQNIKEKHPQQRDHNMRDILIVIGIAICFAIFFKPLTGLISFPINAITHLVMPRFNPFYVFHPNTYTDIPVMSSGFKLASGALIIIPIFLLFYLLIQVFVPFKNNNKKVIIYMLVLWLIALLATGYLTIRHGEYFRIERHRVEIFEPKISPATPEDTLYINPYNQHFA